jgi:hypothetical protein
MTRWRLRSRRRRKRRRRRRRRGHTNEEFQHLQLVQSATLLAVQQRGVVAFGAGSPRVWVLLQRCVK